MHSPEQKSSQLIDRVLAGDQSAFRVMVHDHKRLVSHVVFKMVRNEQDREDLSQEVFLRVYQNLDRFQQQAKLSTWIARIAFNTTINYIEKKRLPLFEDICGEGETIDSCPCMEKSPYERTESRQASVRLSEEIDKLPVNYGLILSLYHLQDMSYREIGQIMSMPDGTVKSYLFRARKMLKDRMQEQFVQEGICA